MSFYISSERTSSCKLLPFSYFDMENRNIILWDNNKYKYTYWHYNKKYNKLVHSDFDYKKKNFMEFYECNNNISNKFKYILDFYNIKYLYVFIVLYYKQSILFIIYYNIKEEKKIMTCIYDNFKEDIIELDIF